MDEFKSRGVCKRTRLTVLSLLPGQTAPDAVGSEVRVPIIDLITF